MLGWQPLPTYAELIGYLVYLVPAALYVLWPARVRVEGPARQDTGTACSSCCSCCARGVRRRGEATRAAASAGPSRSSSPTPAARPRARARRRPHDVQGHQRRHPPVSELEILKGARILGEKENLVAGLSGSFTLTLQPGEYTLSCPGGATPRPAS